MITENLRRAWRAHEPTITDAEIEALTVGPRQILDGAKPSVAVRAFRLGRAFERRRRAAAEAASNAVTCGACGEQQAEVTPT